MRTTVMKKRKDHAQSHDLALPKTASFLLGAAVYGLPKRADQASQAHSAFRIRTQRSPRDLTSGGVVGNGLIGIIYDLNAIPLACPTTPFADFLCKISLEAEHGVR